MPARRKRAVVETEAAQPTPPAAREASIEAPPADAVNPFPRNVKTVLFPDGYAVRLNQDQGTNEMRIQFGSGQRIDKPSDAVLDIIRRQLVSEELQTRKERDEGHAVPWFKYRSDPDTGEGSWRMWMRNHPYAAREKAEQVFNAVADQIAQERGPGRVVEERGRGR